MCVEEVTTKHREECVCSPGIPVLVGTGTTETNIYCRKILRLYLSLVFDDLANLDTALVTNNCI